MNIVYKFEMKRRTNYISNDDFLKDAFSNHYNDSFCILYFVFRTQRMCNWFILFFFSFRWIWKPFIKKLEKLNEHKCASYIQNQNKQTEIWWRRKKNSAKLISTVKSGNGTGVQIVVPKLIVYVCECIESKK